MLSRTLSLFALALLPIAAHGDSIWTVQQSGYTFTTDAKSLSSGKYDVKFTISDPSGSNSYLQGFSLTLFNQNENSVVLQSVSSGAVNNFAVFANQKGNNGGAAAGSCHSGGPAGTFCVEDITNNYGFTKGSSISFDFLVTGSNSLALDPTFDLLANGTKNSNGSKGNIFAISTSGTPTTTTPPPPPPPPPSPVPEPASFALFGSGLLFVATALRRRIRA